LGHLVSFRIDIALGYLGYPVYNQSMDHRRDAEIHHLTGEVVRPDFANTVREKNDRQEV
jgi:hypothetical protein